jgi:hypothetical protein
MLGAAGFDFSAFWSFSVLGGAQSLHLGVHLSFLGLESHTCKLPAPQAQV